jgi:hypothetical protein
MQQTWGPVLSIPPRTRAAPMWPYFYRIQQCFQVRYGLKNNDLRSHLVTEQHLLEQTDCSCNLHLTSSVETMEFQLRRHLKSGHFQISSSTSTSTALVEIKTSWSKWANHIIKMWVEWNLLNVWCHVMQLEAVFVCNNISLSGPGISA